MSIHAINSNQSVDVLSQAKIDLAAAHRLAVFHELEEGIDNHFTVTVPGTEDKFLVLPFGLHWSEAKASDMIVFNEQGDTLEGEGLGRWHVQAGRGPSHMRTHAEGRLAGQADAVPRHPVLRHVLHRRRIRLARPEMETSRGGSRAA